MDECCEARAELREAEGKGVANERDKRETGTNYRSQITVYQRPMPDIKKLEHVCVSFNW
jgi:hypothetical protein